MEKNLENEKAIEKFRKLVEDINVCMFITSTDEEKDHTRPMGTVEIEDDGTLWFFTDKRSIKVEEVERDRSVHLVYAHPGKESYLDIWGRAHVVTDAQSIKDKWSPIVKAWFPGGKDDPNLALLKVSPLNVHYWDAETGKMIALMKIALAAVSGKKLSEGKEGDLHI